MKMYETLEIEIISFANEDIIVTSPAGDGEGQGAVGNTTAGTVDGDIHCRSTALVVALIIHVGLSEEASV